MNRLNPQKPKGLPADTLAKLLERETRNPMPVFLRAQPLAPAPKKKRAPKAKKAKSTKPTKADPSHEARLAGYRAAKENFRYRQMEKVEELAARQVRLEVALERFTVRRRKAMMLRMVVVMTLSVGAVIVALAS